MRVALHDGNAIVATAVMSEALPIYDGDRPYDGPFPAISYMPDDLDPSHSELWLTDADGQLVTDISDQLPHADWSPGRVACRLTDVQPTTSRCPHCWGERIFYVHRAEFECGICDGVGSCPPVPMPGHPGWWEVTW